MENDEKCLSLNGGGSRSADGIGVGSQLSHDLKLLGLLGRKEDRRRKCLHVYLWKKKKEPEWNRERE